MEQLAGKHNSWGKTSFLLGNWSGPIRTGTLVNGNRTWPMVSATINFAATTRSLDNETTPDKRERKRHSADEEEESEEGEEERSLQRCDLMEYK